MLDSSLPGKAPGCLRLLQALEAFAPQLAGSSPQELSSRHSNYGFLEPDVRAWGPASLWNTWLPWGFVKGERGPSC